MTTKDILHQCQFAVLCYWQFDGQASYQRALSAYPPSSRCHGD